MCPGSDGEPRRWCENGSWVPQPPCAANEVCEESDVAQRGECRPAATECSELQAGGEYCDGEMRRRCVDSLRSVEAPCDRNMQCNANLQRCTCKFGTIDIGQGCQAPTDCTIAEGGCDMLTTCMLQDGKPVCSACPDGYLGTGSGGCKPLLTSLDVSCGALELRKDVYEYRIEVPMLCQQLTLRPAVPDGTTIRVNGSPLTAAADWTSEVLGFGDNLVKLTLTSSSGLANEYTLSVARQGAQSGVLKASNPSRDDRFGYRLAVSGETLAVATPWEDGSSGGVNGDQSSSGSVDSGAVYVFVRQGGNWSQQAYIKAMNPVGDEYFGTSLALDGDTLVVGAASFEPFYLTPSANRSGSVDVFVRSGDSWSFQQRLRASNAAAGDMFGYSVLLQGNDLWVGAPHESSQADESGAVYHFTRGANGFAETQRIKAARPVSSGSLGSGLAFDGSSLLVGAWMDSSVASWGGSAYVFTLQSGGWVEQTRLQAPNTIDNLAFGKGLAVLGDTIVVGAPYAPSFTNREGRAFVYQRSGTQWMPTSVLTAPVARNQDFYGVALLLTPTSLAVGANGDASAATGIQGDLNNADAPLAGAIFLYARRGTAFTYSTFVKSLHTATGDAFGAEVGLMGDTVLSASAFESSGGSGVDPRPGGTITNSGAVYTFQ